jgi:sigma-B regulation protein RsbU (phosphoserine phosphatase)
VDENYRYTEYTATAKPGQTLLMFTDGILEARNIKGEMFRKNRFKDVIRRNADLGAEGLHAAIIDAVTTFQGEAQQEDDITLVVLKFL